MIPSSAIIEVKVEKNVVDVFDNCCLVAITETGIVNNWAKAALKAPKANSVIVFREAFGTWGKNFLTYVRLIIVYQ